MNTRAYLLAFLEPGSDGKAVVKGFGVFSEEQPTIAPAEITSRGVWATIHVEHGTDYEDALVAMRRHIRQYHPWIWPLLPELTRRSLTQSKHGPQITR